MSMVLFTLLHHLLFTSTQSNDLLKRYYLLVIKRDQTLETLTRLLYTNKYKNNYTHEWIHVGLLNEQLKR